MSVEALENRRLLAFATITGGVLVVTGTGKVDRFTISSAGEDGQTTIVTRNRVSESYAFGDLARVRVDCRAGDDFVQILTNQLVTVSGGPGNDVIYGGGNSIIELGGDGNDTLYGSGKSRDYLIGGQGSDYIDGGKGSDGVYGDNFATITGIPDVNVIFQGNDTLGGGRGTDEIQGQGGDDLIYGGTQDDYITGGAGDDTMYGGDGRDRFFDSGHDFVEDVNVNGADLIDGQGGRDEWQRVNDTEGTRFTPDNVANDGNADEHDNVVSVEVVYTGSGNDLIDYTALISDGTFGDVAIPVYAETGTGTDTVIGSRYADLIRDAESVLGNDGDDDITGGTGDNTLVGGTGNDTIASSVGDDSLEGNAGRDSIFAGGGNDTVLGNRGNDTLSGEDGNDHIFGGPEVADTIFGGPGNDQAANDTKDTYDSVETLLS